MRLSDDSFKVKSSEPAGYYARALRAIGQDLTGLFPQQVEIYHHGDSFEVRVRCDRIRLEKRASQNQKSGITNTLLKIATYRLDKPAEEDPLATLTQTYGADDIGRLDESGIHGRSQAGKVPDINNLAESLRTVGRIIDAEEGRLIRILKDQRSVSFEFTDRKGATRKTEMTRLELYKTQQSFHAKRGIGAKSLDPWKR